MRSNEAMINGPTVRMLDTYENKDEYIRKLYELIDTEARYDSSII